jgi:hypothetical protein
VADYVATIQVSAGQTVWPADEVPHLTADALYRFEPEPDPMVTKAELRRFTSADQKNRAAGRPLNARELSQFARKCKAAGLPELPDGLRYRQWGEYLEAFNQDAEARGWWARLIPPRDPHQVERLAWVIAAEEHRKLLKAAVANGEIQARMAGTLVPAPGIVNLQRLVLTRDGLVTFAARLAMQVVDMPHFVTSARPLEVPAALLALPDDARVSYEHNIARQRGSGITNAAEYRESIRDTMARQAEGHFTLNEAAQVLADSRPGLDPMETVKRFRLAHSKGELPIHQGGSRFPLEVGETVRDFWDTVEVSELDAWLRASVGYGFPVALPVPPSAAPASEIETPKQRRARLLQMHDAEVSAGRGRGALARITEIEKRTRPTADRSNIGKEIRKAREERDAERKGGALTRLLG